MSPSLSPLVEPTCSPDEWNSLIRTSNDHFGLPMWQEIRRHNLTIFYARDLGDDLSTARKALLASAIATQVQMELADSRFTNKGVPLPDDYTKLATTLLRLLKELGLEKKQAKAPTNDMNAYLAGKASPKLAAVDGEQLPGWYSQAPA